MKKVKGVKKYAKQFLSAVSLDEAPKGIEQLSAVASLMEKDRNVRNILVSPAFTEEESGSVISYLGEKLKMSETAAKYLQYLLSSGAIGALPDIISAISAQYREMKKRAKVVVTSPTAITAGYGEQLAAALRRMTGRDVDLEYAVDPSLLGGVKIQVGSTMYDSSIKGQLGLLKDKLIKG